ncbi:MAG: DUF3048 domain-containing protein [Patescibacteria group bacterium]|nr:DUF3048 domain-containing protein [Patescibacteria group bacterium]
MKIAIRELANKIFKHAEDSGAERRRKLLLAALALGVVLICAASVGTYLTVASRYATPAVSDEPSSAVAADTAPRTIDGVMAAAGRTNLVPIAAMIENHIESRPPSGISRASLVFEAPAEAGITRFLAIFDQDFSSDEVGPVRSARDYYLDWAAEFGALYAHCGGSPLALQKIPSYPIFDLNEFYNGRFFWRDNERTAPHNVYSNSDLLRQAVEAKEMDAVAAYESWRFKDDQPSAAPSANEITINFSTPAYLTRWVYASGTNEYVRFHGEVQHIEKNGDAIKAKNIAIVVTEATVIDYEGRLNLRTLGKGKAWVFRDGGALEATWQKDDIQDRLRFYDVTGREIEFNRGVTWVEVATDASKIKYSK